MSESPSANINISVQITPQHGTWERMRAACIEAEEIGVDGVFNWDHFYPLSGDPDGLHFESYTMLAAVAEATSRVQVGSLVTCNSYRNPNLLADMARTIDHISGGRFILGIGSGWAERDYFNYGYEFGTAASRLKDLGRDLPIIKDRFAKLNPGPVNGTIPILIGGGGEKVTLRLVAQHADAWHAFGAPVETLTHKLNVLRTWCENVERDFSEIELVVGGSTDSLQVNEERAALGFTHFTVGVGGPDFDLDPVRRLVEWRDRVNGG